MSTMSQAEIDKLLASFADGSGYGDPEARRNAEIRLQSLIALQQQRVSPPNRKGPTMKKPLVFFSHIPEEKEIAHALKKLVETTFLNMIEVFVSSHPASIPLGKKWLDEVSKALNDCRVEIVLASPESVKHEWINFEAGAGWVRNIPVIPLCHSGMTPDDLSAPLKFLQGATATEKTELELNLFPVLAKAIGCALPANIDFSEFISVVKAFQETSRESKAMAAITPIAATDGLMPHELATLVEIAEKTYAPGTKVFVHQVRNALEEAGYRGVAVILAINMLSRKNLVETTTDIDENGYGNSEHPAVLVTPDGWSWLQANMDKLSLRIPRQPAPAPPRRPGPAATRQPAPAPPTEAPFGEEQQFKEDDIAF